MLINKFSEFIVGANLDLVIRNVEQENDRYVRPVNECNVVWDVYANEWALYAPSTRHRAHFAWEDETPIENKQEVDYEHLLAEILIWDWNGAGQNIMEVGLEFGAQHWVKVENCLKIAV